MAEPHIADRKPKQVTLEAGEYYWCSCGLSKSQPFCDGSHAGSGFKPKAFSVAEAENACLCMCKRTGGQPYCDGTHAQLADEPVEHQGPPTS